MSKLPHSEWQPLSVSEVTEIFKDAPFSWGVAGGYAVEQFLGATIREHSDIDILVFRDEQLAVQAWLSDWQLYAADPPGTLRRWCTDECLAYGIHDIWGHMQGANAWQLQLMLGEVEGDEWFSRHNNLIRGEREELFVTYQSTNCLRIEVQLLYKARNIRPKDQFDFEACLPHLSGGASQWLLDHLHILFPNGHGWIDRLR